MNSTCNVHVAEGKATAHSRTNEPNRMAADNTETTITVPKESWVKLMAMLERLHENQPEFSKTQAELVKQLAAANARIQELEKEKSQSLSSTPSTAARTSVAASRDVPQGTQDDAPRASNVEF